MSQATVTQINQIPWNNNLLNPPTNPTSRYYLNTILNNYQNFSGTFEIMLDDGNGVFPELDTEIGITLNWILSCDCLGASIYPASVLFASISVECVLNHDLRLDKYRQSQPYQWIDLSFKNLDEACKQGLPTNLLLKNNESFNKKSTMEFVERRNKVAHGDTMGYRNISGGFTHTGFTASGYTTGNAIPHRNHALDQIEMAKKFIVEWASKNPKVRIH